MLIFQEEEEKLNQPMEYNPVEHNLEDLVRKVQAESYMF